MKPKSYKDEGIVLARKNYSEADRILTIYTRHNGKVSFLAKGIRNIKSRKKGHLEVFSNAKLSWVTGKGLNLLSEAHTLNNFSNIRLDLKKTAVAYYLLETIFKITHDEEENGQLFDLLLDSLKRLDENDNTSQVKDEFTKNALIVLGFWPQNLPMHNPHQILEDVLERKLNSARVGKKLLL